MRALLNYTVVMVLINDYLRFQDSNTKSQDIVDDVDLFACPVCYEPLIRKGPPGFNLQSIYRSGFRCNKCKKSYTSKNTYLDLTVTAGAKAYTQFKPAGTELFRSPLISFVYERGWRQNFNRRGFPGPDEEFKMAQEIFKPIEGGILVDVVAGVGTTFLRVSSSTPEILRPFGRRVLRDYNYLTAEEIEDL